jgi:hypothetical protein
MVNCNRVTLHAKSEPFATVKPFSVGGVSGRIFRLNALWWTWRIPVVHPQGLADMRRSCVFTEYDVMAAPRSVRGADICAGLCFR